MLFPDTTAAASSKVNTGTNTKVGVGSARASDNDDEELTLFGVVFAVLRPDASLKTFVFHLRCANSIPNTKILISGAPSSPDETDTPQIVRRRWLHPSGTWRFTTWLYILRLSIVSTDGGACISGATGSSHRSLRLGIESPYKYCGARCVSFSFPWFLPRRFCVSSAVPSSLITEFLPTVVFGTEAVR